MQSCLGFKIIIAVFQVQEVPRGTENVRFEICFRCESKLQSLLRFASAVYSWHAWKKYKKCRWKGVQTWRHNMGSAFKSMKYNLSSLPRRKTFLNNNKAKCTKHSLLFCQPDLQGSVSDVPITKPPKPGPGGSGAKDFFIEMAHRYDATPLSQGQAVSD